MEVGTAGTVARRAIFVTLYWDERVVAATTLSRATRRKTEIFCGTVLSRSTTRYADFRRALPLLARETRAFSARAHTISLDFPHEQTYPSWDLATNRKFVCSSRLNASSHRQYFIAEASLSLSARRISADQRALSRAGASYASLFDRTYELHSRQ